jgi:hypothetical protein
MLDVDGESDPKEEEDAVEICVPKMIARRCGADTCGEGSLQGTPPPLLQLIRQLLTFTKNM